MVAAGDWTMVGVVLCMWLSLLLALFSTNLHTTDLMFGRQELNLNFIIVIFIPLDGRVATEG